MNKLLSGFFSVPGGTDGPSGVLICSENYVTYKNIGDQPDIRCPIPRRRVCVDLVIHFI
jgi:splicing factor 3B subunit 3